jgi:hypothetical protein
MKIPPLVGLVVTGNLARSWFLTVAEQADRLGPVISSNFRVASRFVNTLQAGVPAEDYGLLNPCKLIVVKVGENEWFEVLDGLARARIRWKGKSVILCDTDLESSEWCTLEKLGASVATMLYTEINEQSCYVMEGDPRAVSDAQTILNLPRVRVIELARSHKALYLACREAAAMIVPLAAAAEEDLRRAGVRADTAAWMVEHWFQDGLRAYKKAGRRAWNGNWYRFRSSLVSSLDEGEMARMPPGQQGSKAAGAAAGVGAGRGRLEGG